jgi:hypothetical protein
MNVTITIYEAYGVKYDRLFRTSREKVIELLKKCCDTVCIHYIEEIPEENLTPHAEIITR